MQSKICTAFVGVRNKAAACNGKIIAMISTFHFHYILRKNLVTTLRYICS
jgi:hypothetical protein